MESSEANGGVVLTSDPLETDDDVLICTVSILKAEDFGTILISEKDSNSISNMEESEVCSDRASGLVDSCSTHVLSCYRSDFEWISDRPTVRLNAADGKVAGGKPCAFIWTR